MPADRKFSEQTFISDLPVKSFDMLESRLPRQHRGVTMYLIVSLSFWLPPAASGSPHVGIGKTLPQASPSGMLIRRKCPVSYSIVFILSQDTQLIYRHENGTPVSQPVASYLCPGTQTTISEQREQLFVYLSLTFKY